MILINDAYQHAVTVLKYCARQQGFFASGLAGGYEAVWARDSMIAALGASLVGKKFQFTFKKSLKMLATFQSNLGQIPNAVGSYNLDRRSKITYNTIDSTLWYIIGHFVYKKAYHDNSLWRRYQKSIDRAFLWLKYQDPNEVQLLTQQPTMDWQDAFPHKYGHAISTQALYYVVLRILNALGLAEHIKKIINGKNTKYLSLFDGNLGYYLPWIWKNHDGDREQEKWFDTFGNVAAIVTGLATPTIGEQIITHMKKNKIDRPYPCKAIYPPLTPRDPQWHSYFTKCDAKTPYHYLNAGIWPFIGGLYVAALVKLKKFSHAQRELLLLAHAVKLRIKSTWGFHEWLHGKTGKPIGNSNPYQAWTAGMYIFAYTCVKIKKVPYFF